MSRKGSQMTPSKLRRRGREDFIAGEDPKDHYPWNIKTYSGKLNYQHWLDGWEEERAKWEYNKNQVDRFQTLPETHQQGHLFVEQELTREVRYGDLGIQISDDGRVWICFNGQALLRFTPA